ncbi:Replication termination factor 2 [Coemansia javaensis]|uniref:Replication termination factor 2 n=1 Tax=Coemansia javaensis TaxID=2761396 RepID=A0A9W8HM47_9FUNG|nr:Replication termination factor 2 [Coemansia javaensis]
MGNDGGSIPRRNEMVREKKRGEGADRQAQLAAMCSLCALSNEPLRKPVVGDGLGRLYNREAVLEYLLERAAPNGGGSSKACAHIRSLKDVVALSLEPNPARAKAGDGTGAPFVCPITMKEMNGGQPFEFLWTCGCVFSAQARREMPGTSACPVCSRSFGPGDVVPVGPVDTEVLDALRGRMAERAKERAAKAKSKGGSKDRPKRKHTDGGDGAESGAGSAAAAAAAAAAGPEQKRPKAQQASA